MPYNTIQDNKRKTAIKEALPYLKMQLKIAFRSIYGNQVENMDAEDFIDFLEVKYGQD